jgi:xanthine dehydrogenase accessory factor
MAVFPDMEINTIGGGHLELQAIQKSRGMLSGLSEASGVEPQIVSFALGPALGQCCGGVVQLKFEWVSEKDLPVLKQRLQTTGMPVALFGGGHVGTALVQVMSRLPMNLHWIDSRDEIFPTELPLNVTTEHSDPVQSAVADLLPNSAVLIMSFSHAEDLDVVMACLQRQRQKHDLRYVGLIGSKTKWATFRHRLESRGFSQEELAFITCPIGVPGITGKEPEVIAVAVAAQLLQLA